MQSSKTARLEINKELRAKNLPLLSGNIYCIGRNYAKHAEELGNAVPTEPVIFLKSPSSLRQWRGGELAFGEETLHHEIELVLLLGEASDLSEQDGKLPPIAAITLGLDLTRRGKQNDLKKAGLPWTRSKSFTGSACLGPWVVPSEGLPPSIDLELFINDKLRQKGHSDHMIFGFDRLLEELSEAFALEAGDLIFTGTPEGVGPIKQGDRMRAVSHSLGLDIEGIL